MQDKAKGARPRRSNHPQDIRDQGVVLAHVLDLHPVNLILPELVSGLTEGSEDFEEGDRFTRAVRDLAASGLLGFHRALVVPTQAALRFNQIMETIA